MGLILGFGLSSLSRQGDSCMLHVKVGTGIVTLIMTSFSRRNCKGNPNCLVGIGEQAWLGEIDENAFHNIDDPNSERRDKVFFCISSTQYKLFVTCLLSHVISLLWVDSSGYQEYLTRHLIIFLSRPSSRTHLLVLQTWVQRVTSTHSCKCGSTTWSCDRASISATIPEHRNTT